ncbi:MAG: hypothetical protein COA65_06800 [Rhodospirillaceae bacterium]|nr:MAG: hypothetical protein COA65_06800 [Rhodospirillaceae bacterium]
MALLLLAVVVLAPGAFAYPSAAPVASMESADTHSTSMHSAHSTDRTQGSAHACCDQHEGGACPADMNCNLPCGAFSGLFAVLPEIRSAERTPKMYDPIQTDWNRDGRLIAQNTPPPRS